MPRELPTHWYFLLFILLLGANIFLFQGILSAPTVKVTPLNVGEKGSATLVRAKDGTTILIDTGPDASLLRALGTKLPPWRRTIDMIILTSDKKDAVGGLLAVKSRYNINQQITLTESQRLTIDATSYIDIVLTKNAPAGVSVSIDDAVTTIK